MKKTVIISNTVNADIHFLRKYDSVNILRGLNLIIINDRKRARQIAGFLKYQDHFDIFIVSNHRRVLSDIHQTFPYVRLVYEPKKMIFDVQKLINELFQAHSFTILLNQNYANQDIIRQFHSRGVKVIIRAENELEVARATLAGADGVLGIDIERFSVDADITTLPFLISHRGVHEQAVENTIESGLIAHKMGCDFVEMDVHTSLDNHVIVNHDNALGRTFDRDFVIKRNRLKELKVARQVKNKEVLEGTISTLSEFNHAIPRDIGFIVESKVDSKRDIKRIAKCLNQTSRNIMVMSFYPYALVRLDKYAKRFMNGFLVDLNDKRVSLNHLLRVIHRYRLVVHPYYLHNKPEIEANLKKRMIGYSPWGLSEDATYQALYNDHDMINSNFVHRMAHLSKQLKISHTITYPMGEFMKLNLTNEKNNPLSYKIHVLFDNPLKLSTENDAIVSAEKVGETYIYLTHTTNFNNHHLTYASDLIKVVVEDKHKYLEEDKYASTPTV